MFGEYCLWFLSYCWFMETHKASLGLKSFILNFAKGVFPNLTPLLLTSLSHCSQIHAGSSVVYTLAHAPKERVILCFFFTPAFKAYQCDLCLYIFLNFETLFTSRGRQLCYKSWLCPSSNMLGVESWLSFAVFLMSADNIGTYCVWKVNIASSAVFHEEVIMEAF